MDFQPKDFCSTNALCEFCRGVARTRCSRCCVVFYCSEEHQRQHWPVHEKVCKKSQPMSSVTMTSRNISNEPFLSFPPGTSNDAFIGGIPPGASQGMFVNTVQASSDAFMNMNLSNIAGASFASLENWCQSTMPCSKNEGLNPPLLPCTVSSTDSSNILPQDIALPPEHDLFSLSNEYLTEDTSFWNLLNACAQDAANYSNLFEGNTLSETANPQTNASFATGDESIDSCVGPDPGSLLHRLSISELSKIIVRDMNACGICVLDKFVGSNYGSLILQEVKNLYMKGIFRKGELVRSNVSHKNVRSDVTTWVQGDEPYCKYIGNLMRKLDLIVSTCNILPNNGIFSNYKLHKRTQAMIACYPGDGSHYKKHIDNPSQDGRCITCIYYLNKNWDSAKHGGLLRMFPSANESYIANIHPFFDRVIFFWSDKRNPHEVLPSYATRFAITLWYFDADERERALSKLSKNRALMKTRNQ